MEYAKELMDRYTAQYDDEGVLVEDQDLPWDWTEELMWQFEEEFYAAKDTYQKLNKSLEGVRKIKEEVDRVKKEQADKLKQDAEEARESRKAIVKAVDAARIKFEEYKLVDGTEIRFYQENLNEMKHAYEEALNAYYENTHMLEQLAFQEAQEGAMDELMEVYNQREQDKAGDENELQNFKGAYDQAKTAAKAEQDKLNDFRDDAAKAKKALTKAENALAEDPNNQNLIDAKNQAEQNFNEKDGKIQGQQTLYEEKKADIETKLAEFNEKQAEKADNREQVVVD